MHEGQKQFFDYILSRVADGKRKEAEQLLQDAFSSQAQNTFDADALSAFHRSILALIKPECVDEVNGILTRHGEQHTNT